MKKSKVLKMLAAGSFLALASCQAVMRPYAKATTERASYMVSGPEECRRLMMELASSVSGRERREFYVTGEDYDPETLTIAQMFPETINISNTKVWEYTENGQRYVTCRIGFERRPDTGGCSHQWAAEILEAGTCLWGGKERMVCELCGLEKVLSQAPPGHVDGDGDFLCDRCGSRINGDEEMEAGFWSVDDVQVRKIGEKVYRFRCIDDDYRREDSDYQKCALFLCEAVIRSDVDSTDSKREILTFGETNNYKTSAVRKWLLAHSGGDTEELVSVNTGVNSAFLGKTKPGTYGEFAKTELTRRELSVQTATDKIFLLSLEEALKYREELWDVSGGGSPYSQGYWLRTPAYLAGEDGRFLYGTEEYAVDLEQGCICPAEVSDGSIGIRPAFCLPQA